MKYRKYYLLSHVNAIKLAVSKNTTTKRHRTAAKNVNNTQKSHWLWVLAGVLVGVLISSAIFFKLQSTNQNIASIKKSFNNSIKKARATTTKPKEKEPVFDFYTVLPNMDTTTTNNTESNKLQYMKKTSTATVSEVKSEPIKNIKYLVQIATFTKMDAADELKAELTLAGFDANIEPLQKNNTTWYRIIMGPFNSEQQAIKQQQLLAKQNINGNLLRIEQ
jgi:cell division protein FtsN